MILQISTCRSMTRLMIDALRQRQIKVGSDKHRINLFFFGRNV
jgi:hypothetical protein